MSSVKSVLEIVKRVFHKLLQYDGGVQVFRNLTDFLFTCLSIIEGGVLISPTIVLDLSISLLLLSFLPSINLELCY